MDDQIEKYKQRISPEFFKLPLELLSNETKEKLKYMDCRFIVPDNEVKLRDYRGLAVLMNFNMMQVNSLIDGKHFTSPTLIILDKMKQNNMMLSDLIIFLLQLKRFDVLDSIKVSILEDIERHRKMQKATAPSLDFERLVTEQESNEARSQIEKLFTTDLVRTDDDENTSAGSIRVYDIFISFDSESVNDIHVMWNLSTLLENSGLTVAKGSFSFFQGCCLVDAYARAIYNRSRKVILLLSHSYVRSESCLMQLSFAKDADKAAWKNKVIPVYIENVTKPESIAHLNGFRYYNEIVRTNYMQNFIASMKYG